MNRQTPARALDLDLSRPAAGGNHDMIGGHRLAAVFDHDLAAGAANPDRARPLDQLSPEPLRRHRQRVRQRARHDIAVRRDDQAADHVGRGGGFFAPNRRRVEQLRR